MADVTNLQYVVVGSGTCGAYAVQSPNFNAKDILQATKDAQGNITYASVFNSQVVIDGNTVWNNPSFFMPLEQAVAQGIVAAPPATATP